MTYEDFLRAKMVVAPARGLDVEAGDVNQLLKLFEEAQADAVRFRHERDQLREDLQVTQQALSNDKTVIAQQHRRIDDLIQANNAELARRRKFEAEANQEYCEKLLLRQECIRLREANCVLASHIEEAHANAGEPVPEGIAASIDALFPGDPDVDNKRLIRGLRIIAASKLSGIEYGDFVQQACEDLLEGREVEPVEAEDGV